MISDEQTQLVLNLARKQIADHGQPDFKAIKQAIFKKYCENYHEKLLENLYEAEKDNPRYRPREIEEYYVDTKRR
jgi:hypothetical protein